MSIEDIDADTLAVRIAGWQTLVLDLRDENAFRAARIPDAILIRRNGLATSLQGLPVGTSLCLICETWEQSQNAAKLLWDMGYRRIAVLRGGFATYVERGLPVSTL